MARKKGPSKGSTHGAERDAFGRFNSSPDSRYWKAIEKQYQSEKTQAQIASLRAIGLGAGPSNQVPMGQMRKGRNKDWISVGGHPVNKHGKPLQDAGGIVAITQATLGENRKNKAARQSRALQRGVLPEIDVYRLKYENTNIKRYEWVFYGLTGWDKTRQVLQYLNDEIYSKDDSEITTLVNVHAGAGRDGEWSSTGADRPKPTIGKLDALMNKQSLKLALQKGHGQAIFELIVKTTELLQHAKTGFTGISKRGKAPAKHRKGSANGRKANASKGGKGKTRTVKQKQASKRGKGKKD